MTTANYNSPGGCYDLMLTVIVPVDILGTDYVAVKGPAEQRWR